MESIDSKDLGMVDGFAVVAYLVPDVETSVHDFDCYSDAQIHAWLNDHWSYVTVVVTASRHGVELGRATLWGCEYGVLPGVEGWVSPLDDDAQAYEIVPEAIDEARETARRLVADASE